MSGASTSIYLKMRKTQEIEGKDNGNIEISENLVTSPINGKNKSTKTYKKLKNIRAEKLQNTKFIDIDNNCYFNRYASRRLALSSSKLPKKCTGNKVINIDLINDSLQFMSPANICCERYRSKSRIALYQDPNMKYGLSEKLMFYCENCKNTLKSFKISKATSLRKSNTKAYEVNVRSVLAAVPIGQTGLKRFCADLDLPLPVTKKPFNDILLLLSKINKNHYERSY